MSGYADMKSDIHVWLGDIEILWNLC